MVLAVEGGGPVEARVKPRPRDARDGGKKDGGSDGAHAHVPDGRGPPCWVRHSRRARMRLGASRSTLPVVGPFDLVSVVAIWMHTMNVVESWVSTPRTGRFPMPGLGRA